MASSPTVWRRWLAHELLRLRLAAGYERADVAKRIPCTPQKIGHLETATVPPKIKDLEDVLLPMYGVPQELWSRYLQAARDARQKGWWESHAEVMSDWFSRYVGLEYGASELHCWEPQLVNGLLQTWGYAAAVLRGGTPERSDAQLEQQARLRLQRQRVLDHEDPPRLWVVLDESVLHANVGGPEVMREQLHHLIEAASRPRVTVQVLRGDIGAHPGMLGAFSLLDFPTEGDLGVVYLEHRTGGLYIEHPPELNDYRAAWDRLVGLALSPTASTELITETARGLR
jgi:Domain of unknown function (DUF5753)/Helix-turn-helix domain